MAKERKIRCDCGEFLVERKILMEHFETDALVCPKCGFSTLTKEQAHKYAELKLMHQIVDAERKIIRIGNSMGFTLPDELKRFGARVGKNV